MKRMPMLWATFCAATWQPSGGEVGATAPPSASPSPPLLPTSPPLFISNTIFFPTAIHAENKNVSNSGRRGGGGGTASHRTTAEKRSWIKVKPAAKMMHPIPRTRRAWKESEVLVMYNRIPKTGSASLLAGIKAAAGAEHGPFRWHGHSYNGRYHLDQAKETRSSILTFCQHLAELSRPGVFALHTTYLECPSLPVVYINQVRDPIDRFVSQRLFFQNCVCNPPKHGGKWCAERRTDLVPTKAKFCGMQLNDLAAWALEDAAAASTSSTNSKTGPPKTTTSIKNVMNVYTAYFCGAGTFASLYCTDTNSPEALALAKNTLEHQFKWVGILEEPDISRQVLEHKLPTFFGKEVYKDVERVAHHGDAHFANGTLARSSEQSAVALSGAVHDRVKAVLANDYALYQFAKQLIRKQADLLVQG